MTDYRTRQEILSIGYIGVMKQGGPSVNDTGETCMYRGHDGRRCHIGHLIDDADYVTGFEGDSVFALAVHKAARIDLNDVDLANYLQCAHDRASAFVDSATFLADYTRRVKSIAAEYGLTVPEVG